MPCRRPAGGRRRSRPYRWRRSRGWGRTPPAAEGWGWNSSLLLGIGATGQRDGALDAMAGFGVAGADAEQGGGETEGGRARLAVGGDLLDAEAAGGQHGDVPQRAADDGKVGRTAHGGQRIDLDEVRAHLDGGDDLGRRESAHDQEEPGLPDLPGHLGADVGGDDEFGAGRDGLTGAGGGGHGAPAEPGRPLGGAARERLAEEPRGAGDGEGDLNQLDARGGERPGLGRRLVSRGGAHHADDRRAAQAQSYGVVNLEGGSHGAGSLSSIFPRGIQLPGGKRPPSEVSLPDASAGGTFFSGTNGKWQCLRHRQESPWTSFCGGFGRG